MAKVALVNEEWDLTVGGDIVFFFKTQLSAAESYLESGMAYRYGWKNTATGASYILLSVVAPTDAEVEATFTP